MPKSQPNTKQFAFMRNSGRQWTYAATLLAALCLIMLEYHSWRGKPYTLFSFNKAIAIASTILIGLSITAGPVLRRFGRGKGFLASRRPLAVIGAAGVVIHTALSFMQPQRFDLTYYRENWLSLVFGFAAFCGLIAMWMTSYRATYRKLGSQAWMKLHSFGWLFLFMAALHVLALGKAANWLNWAKTLDKPVPPGTIVPVSFILVVLGFRALDAYLSGREE